jgi:hypothetical protein
MLLDTGSTITTLDSKYRNYLGQPLASQYDENIFSRSIATVYGCPEIFIGKRRVAPLLALVDDINSPGKPVDVIMGMNSVKNCVVTFDSDNDIFTIGGAVPENMKKNALVIPLKEARLDLFGIDASVNGERIFLIVDTGLDSSISLTESDWQRIFSGLHPKSASQLVRNSDGQFKAEQIARLGALSVGTSIYSNLIAAGAPSPRAESLIGRAFLRRHVCTFDFPNRKLYLMPGRHFNQADETDMTGMNLGYIEDKLIVYKVDKGSPAY